MDSEEKIKSITAWLDILRHQIKESTELERRLLLERSYLCSHNFDDILESESDNEPYRVCKKCFLAEEGWIFEILAPSVCTEIKKISMQDEWEDYRHFIFLDSSRKDHYLKNRAQFLLQDEGNSLRN